MSYSADHLFACPYSTLHQSGLNQNTRGPVQGGVPAAWISFDDVQDLSHQSRGSFGHPCSWQGAASITKV
jgi:hypothetical protein